MRTIPNDVTAAVTALPWTLTRSAPDTARTIVATDSPIFAGHYPGRPIVPGVFLLALAVQATTFLHGRRVSAALTVDLVRFLDIVRPGDRLDVTVHTPEDGPVHGVIAAERGQVCRFRFAPGGP